MNLSLPRSLAATGAATVIVALGAFAAVSPASAAPGNPGGPGTLSGNVVHGSANVVPNDVQINVEQITEQQFESHGDSEYGNNCAQDDAVQYCEYFADGYNAGTTWDAYIAVPQGTTLDATVTIDYPDSFGNDVKLTAPVDADSPYVHLSATVSPYTEETIASEVGITLGNGSVYQASSQWTLHTGEYAGRVSLFAN